MIRGMLAHRPDLTGQQILAYFSRPGRDINSRVIGEIRTWRWHYIPVASEVEVDRYIARMEAFWRIAPAFMRGTVTESGRRLLLNWWPVGQGLFASGAITGGRAPLLNWVYDCGTSSADSLIVAALDDFKRQQLSIGASEIRLCVLSHFDRDHISGIVQLIGRLPVRTLLLPYIPLWRRLIIAIEQGVGTGDDLFGFFLDPVAWLAERGDGRIGEIILVAGDSPDDVSFAVPAPEGEGSGDLDDLELDLKLEYGDTPPEAEDDPSVARASHGLQVNFLCRGGRLFTPFLWEFVPYNDASLAPKVNRLFLQDAAPLIARLRDEPDERDDALAALKRLYDRQFGKGAKPRNLVSLFLYSGPIGTRIRLGHGQLGGLPPNAVDFAQMHTGDGLLDEAGRYQAYERFYRGGGWFQRAKVFQIMHHGARSSWHAGFAAKVAPVVSIFSSDPDNRWHHPHAEVLRDFWPFGPQQVHKTKGYALRRRLVLERPRGV